jgi:hypothetical protein
MGRCLKMRSYEEKGGSLGWPRALYDALKTGYQSEGLFGVCLFLWFGLELCCLESKLHASHGLFFRGLVTVAFGCFIALMLKPVAEVEGTE